MRTLLQTSLVQLGFCASAYSPLVALIGAYLLGEHPWLGLLLLASFFLAAAGMRLLLWWRSRTARGTENTYTLEGSTGDMVAGYIATYILPFALLDRWDRGVISAYLAFVLMMLFLHVRTGLGAINPLIFLAGWRITQARLDGRLVFLVHKRPLGSARVRSRAFGPVHIVNSNLPTGSPTRVAPT